MSASPDRAELSEKNRETLDHIERHATTHNLAWDDVLALVRQIADVREESGGHYKVSLGDHDVTIARPKHDAVDEQTVLQLRDLFKDAGYTLTQD